MNRRAHNYLGRLLPFACSALLAGFIFSPKECCAVSIFGFSGDEATAPLQGTQIVQKVGEQVATEGTKAAHAAQKEATGWSYHAQQMAQWLYDTGVKINSLNTAIDELMAFGDPSKIASLVGLDGLLGDGSSGLGGLLKTGMSIGSSVMNTFDSVQNLASKGMALYGIGQSVAGGDYLGALSQAGMGDIAGMVGSVSSMVGIENSLNSFGGSLTGYRQMGMAADSAWSNVGSALRQVQGATTTSEVQKAKANLAVQLGHAQDLTARQTAQQRLQTSQFSAQELREEYAKQYEDEAAAEEARWVLGGIPKTGEAERAYRRNMAALAAAQASQPTVRSGASRGGASGGSQMPNGTYSGNTDAALNQIGTYNEGYVAGVNGYCARGVNKTLEAYTGQPITASSGYNANVAGPVLQSRYGMVPASNTGAYRNGDTIVYQGGPQGYGHIETYFNGSWSSDFQQSGNSLNNDRYTSSQLYRFP